MEKLLLSLIAIFSKIEAFFSQFEKMLHQEFLGFDVFYIFTVGMFIVLLLLLYLLFSFKLRKTRKEIRSLHDKFESFKDEINLQVASSGPNKSSADAVIEEMFSSKKVSREKIKEEQTDVRSVDEPENFFEELPGEKTGEFESSMKKPEPSIKPETEPALAVNEESIEKEVSKEIKQPLLDESEEKGQEISVHENDIDALEPKLTPDEKEEPQKSKKEDQDSTKTIGDLFNGLEDDSNPFTVESSLSSDPPSEKSEQPETASNEISDSDSPPLKINPNDVEIVKPPPETPQEKVEIQTDEKVSWDDKTAMKSNESDVVDSVDLVEISTDELSQPEFFDNVSSDDDSTDDENDRTKIDSIDRNIEFGSEEISINIEDEPIKTIDAQGQVEERRSSERIAETVDCQMVFEGFTDFITQCSVDISSTGMFLKTQKIQPVGTKIKLDVKLKDGYKLLQGEGEVVRVEEAQGMGIKFISLDDESKTLVNRIVDQRQA